MKVYLVRHGDALDAAENPDRPLSDAGRADIERLTAYLKTQALRVEATMHSTKLRARETAEMLHSALKGSLEEHAGIGPNDDPVTVAADLRTGPEEDLCFVSHLPFVSQLASELLAGNQSVAFNFETGGILCLERESTGRWWVNWFLSPAVLPFV